MKIDDARIGMRVTRKGLHERGIILGIIQSPIQPKVKLIQVKEDNGMCRDWHPDHWEPVDA